MTKLETFQATIYKVKMFLYIQKYVKTSTICKPSFLSLNEDILYYFVLKVYVTLIQSYFDPIRILTFYHYKKSVGISVKILIPFSLR